MPNPNNDYEPILNSLLSSREQIKQIKQIVEYDGIKIPAGTQQGVCGFCRKQKFQPCNGTIAWTCINLNRVMQVIQSKLDNNFLLTEEESTLLALVRC